MGYGYGLVKLEGEFRLFQFFAGMNDRFRLWKYPMSIFAFWGV